MAEQMLAKVVAEAIRPDLSAAITQQEARR